MALLSGEYMSHVANWGYGTSTATSAPFQWHAWDTSSASDCTVWAVRKWNSLDNVPLSLLQQDNGACDAWREWQVVDTTTLGQQYRTHLKSYLQYPSYDYGNAVCGTPSRRFRLRQMIRERCAPAILGTRKGLPSACDPREQRSRETLRSIVGDTRYRCFLRHGFVSVRNPISQRVYQIFTGHRETVVYEHGKQICRLCVVLPAEFAPTDSVITRYLLALNNEDRLWQLANRRAPLVKFHRTPSSRNFPPIRERSLVDLYHGLV